MNKNKKYKLATLAVHAGYEPDSTQNSVAVPIYQTTAYSFNSVDHAAKLFSLEEQGNLYTRLGNPTTGVLEDRVAAMDGGVGALAMASGHAAIFNTILNLANCGDEIISSSCIYGGAVNLLGVTLANLGIKVHFVNPDNLDEWESHINDKTKALFVEVIGNPNANVADIEKLAQLAHNHGLPLIVDATFTTPYLHRPIEFGADIVIHSASKYLGGQGNSLAGIVVDSGNFQWLGNDRFPQYNNPDKSYHGLVFGRDVGNAGFITRLRALLLRDIGACLSPFNAFLILQGIETLPLRMRQHCDNSLAVAKFLEQHPMVDAVHYPMLEKDPYYPLAQKYMPKGAGSLFTFELKGGRETGAKFIESVELFMNVTNIGDTRSLVAHPASTTHSQLSREQLAAAGISDTTVRLSIGIEDTQDILDDLEQAIDKATK